MLIAFEGLDQSGKETQARRLADSLRADGRRVETAFVSRLRDTDRPRDRRARLTGERDFGPDVMQLLYIANRYERKPLILEWLDRRRRCRLRSVCGVEHRLRRVAGARRDVAGRDTAAPAAAGSDHRPRHRARNRRRSASAPTAIATSATSPLLARVRESYQHQAQQPTWAVVSGEQPVDAIAAQIRQLAAQARTLVRAFANADEFARS